MMELMLTFGVPQSITNDGWGEFTAQVVGHLCRWLNVALNHGPADFAGTKLGAAERKEATSLLTSRKQLFFSTKLQL